MRFKVNNNNNNHRILNICLLFCIIFVSQVRVYHAFITSTATSPNNNNNNNVLVPSISTAMRMKQKQLSSRTLATTITTTKATQCQCNGNTKTNFDYNFRRRFETTTTTTMMMLLLRQSEISNYRLNLQQSSSISLQSSSPISLRKNNTDEETDYFNEGTERITTTKIQNNNNNNNIINSLKIILQRINCPALYGLTSKQYSNLLQSSVSALTLRRKSSSSSVTKSTIRHIVTQFVLSTVFVWQLLQFTNSSSSINLLQIINGCFSKFTIWYMSCLTKSPLITKCVTAGMIGLTGDTVAQAYEEKQKLLKKEQQQVNNDNNNNHNKRKWNLFGLPLFYNYNKRRGISSLCDDLFISGPLLHYSYNWLESIVPIDTSTAAGGGIGVLTTIDKTIAALVQVLIDDILFDALFIIIMMFSTGIIEGYKLKHILMQYKNDLIPSIKTSYKTSFFLIPIEFICFRFLPLSLRVLGMNIIDIIWCTIVSFMIHKNRKQSFQINTTTTTTTTATNNDDNNNSLIGKVQQQRQQQPNLVASIATET